eukprot:m.246247 g.246247  ORF g.246247 m.246247 type:complete len:125 (+) comp16116_c0_seq7:268-642(+)
MPPLHEGIDSPSPEDRNIEGNMDYNVPKPVTECLHPNANRVSIQLIQSCDPPKKFRCAVRCVRIKPTETRDMTRLLCPNCQFQSFFKESKGLSGDVLSVGSSCPGIHGQLSSFPRLFGTKLSTL